MTARSSFSIVALVVFAIMATVSVYAYSSASVTAGDSMFFVKKLGEKIAIAVSSDEDAYNVYAKIAERRLDEFNYMAVNEFKAVEFSLILPVNASEELELSETEIKTEVIETLELMLAATENSLNAIERIKDASKAEKALEVLINLQNREEDALEKAINNIEIDEDDGELMEKVAVKLEDIKFNKEETKRIKEKTGQAKNRNEKSDLAIETRGEYDEKIFKSFGEVEKIVLATKDGLDNWKAEVLENSTDTEQYDKLFEKIDGRVLKIEEALNEGKTEQAYGLLKSVEAFKNNADYFAGQPNAGERDRIGESDDVNNNDDKKNKDQAQNGKAEKNEVNDDVNEIINSNTGSQKMQSEIERERIDYNNNDDDDEDGAGDSNNGDGEGHGESGGVR